MTPTEKTEKEIVYVQAPYMEGMDDDEIDLLELWNVIWSAKWFIMGFSLLCTLIAVLVTLYVLPVIYKSDATLQPTTSSSSAMSKLAGLVGNLPIDLPGGGDDKSAGLMAFLQSRTLKERLFTKYGLLQRIHKDDRDAVNNKWLIDDPEDIPTIIWALQTEELKSIYGVDQDKKTSLVTLSWSDEDPAFAKTMIDRIIAELQHYLDKEYVTDAKRERVFVEDQLKKATKELDYWERQVPSDTLTLSTITRERLAAQTVYTELRKQLELSKITEAKELVTFKVLDAPFVPEKKDKPKRSLICALTLVGSGFLAIFIVFVRRFVRNVREENVPSSKE